MNKIQNKVTNMNRIQNKVTCEELELKFLGELYPIATQVLCPKHNPHKPTQTSQN